MLLAIGWSNVASVALAAGADNAYVSVYSMEAAAAYTIDNDIYLLSEQLSSLVSELLSAFRQRTLLFWSRLNLEMSD